MDIYLYHPPGPSKVLSTIAHEHREKKQVDLYSFSEVRAEAPGVFSVPSSEPPTTDTTNPSCESPAEVRGRAREVRGIRPWRERTARFLQVEARYPQLLGSRMGDHQVIEGIQPGHVGVRSGSMTGNDRRSI